MENQELPETTRTIQELLKAFANSKGNDNFGYIIATYEKTSSGKYFVGSGIFTDTSEHTHDLTESLSDMFRELAGDDKTDKRTSEEIRDDNNLGLN